LVHALGHALGWPLDTHGAAVIDFQQSGSSGIYPALAQAFGIPWHMIVDGDQQGEQFRQQILDRGFDQQELDGRFTTLVPPNDLEDQLIADGHEPMLRHILAEKGDASSLICTLEEFRGRLKKRKTRYMGVLSSRVAADRALAERMPKAFVTLITSIRDGGP
jgi:putative ATP-dependent endonuclease of OLD family